MPDLLRYPWNPNLIKYVEYNVEQASNKCAEQPQMKINSLKGL